MPETPPKALLNRSVLTDTLPYEVPVIFSNDKFHAALSAEMPEHILSQWLKIGMEGTKYTKPYNYDIAKDDLRYTTLSVVHPRLQKRMADFYELHSSSIISHCDDGKISLRRPTSLASPYIASESNDPLGKLKMGVAQLLVEEGQPDVSHMPSYFSYGKYNLLRKFIGSREFIRLESRYLRYRSLDISKCFYNLYSHTISWAVKEKQFAKDHSPSYSFEGEFDKLMQLCNYNETNGIVVGPEFSRLFAEIILQDVDDRIVAALAAEGLRFGKDYDIRRYVDDYFVFTNAGDTMELIEREVRRQLECYKLYINERKIESANRPFVSKLSVARQDVAALLREINSSLYELSHSTEIRDARRHYSRLKALLAEVRLVVSKYEIAFANVTGWIMSRLKRVLRKSILALKGDLAEDIRPLVADVVTTVLEQAFFLCAIDFRVRSTYSVAQICLMIDDERDIFSEEQRDLLIHVVMDNCSAILRSFRHRSGKKYGRADSVEAFNLLIVGALFVGTDFLRASDTRDALAAFMSTDRLTYFSYITLKFCFLKDVLFFGPDLLKLNDMTKKRLLDPEIILTRDTEEFLLLCDFVSAPDIPSKEKRDLLNQMLDTTYFGHKGVADLAKWVGFVDWDGLSVHHLLAKKELRPVYAWG